jgi:dTDP-4-dehydrorhamnose reductase
MKNAAATRLLILGANGMLGHAALRLFAGSEGFLVFGSTRSREAANKLPPGIEVKIFDKIDATDDDHLRSLLTSIRPNIVINCVGVIKHLAAADNPLIAIPTNSLFPHRLVALCQEVEARLVHISTDCVFSGRQGSYRETDRPDADDLYGRTKLLGEVDYENAVTLRTSIIGPELGGSLGLVGWFLQQNQEVRGFTRAIFSGLTTHELARVIRDFVIPRSHLRGVYHVSADPISKHDLLRLVATEYGKTISIVPSDTPVIDRSLNSDRFQSETAYRPPPWRELISQMRQFG